MHKYSTNVWGEVMKFKSSISTIRLYIILLKDYSLIDVLPSLILPLLSVLFQIMFWKSVSINVESFMGVSSQQILTYIFLANILKYQFNIYTPATTSIWEGSIIRYYTKPMGIVRQLLLEVVGKQWIPQWLFFSVPTTLVMCIIGIPITPFDGIHFGAFLISMMFSIIIGVEVDLIFASIAVRLENGCWAAEQIRNALMIVLTGQVIPFQLLPEFIGKILTMLPFASIANTPISIYIGGDIFIRLVRQMIWSVFLGLLAYVLFLKSTERMISNGG